ncbi:hypothetical protein CDL15_Pgr015323 [Punica granatum]|uniref:Uncharacterized protein n=1 Tax=Punica granatum TaxID=22663 RepID=A0A218W0A5_PUNGR|nr:hypothetical protein CDL15_Pgr015323 [Punica granatum]
MISTGEVQLQCITNAPTDQCLRTASCGAQGTIFPLSSTFSTMSPGKFCSIMSPRKERRNVCLVSINTSSRAFSSSGLGLALDGRATECSHLGRRKVEVRPGPRGQC